MFGLGIKDFSITIAPSKKTVKKSDRQTLDDIAKRRTRRETPLRSRRLPTQVVMGDHWKYYGRNTWFRRCKDPKTNLPFWTFGVTSDNDAEPTTNTFTCNLNPREQLCYFNLLQDTLFEIAWELAKHREQAKCDCDVEWMSRRQTKQKTLRICAGTPQGMNSIWKLMNDHDELCRCGCFSTAKDEQSWELVQKQ